MRKNPASPLKKRELQLISTSLPYFPFSSENEKGKGISWLETDKRTHKQNHLETSTLATSFWHFWPCGQNSLSKMSQSFQHLQKPEYLVNVQNFPQEARSYTLIAEWKARVSKSDLAVGSWRMWLASSPLSSVCTFADISPGCFRKAVPGVWDAQGWTWG